MYVVREVADRFIEGVVRGRRGPAPRRPDGAGTPRWARWSRASSSRSCSELVDDAVAAGATLRCGGPRELPELPGADFYAPAVLTGVTHDMRIMREEIFGPVVPIVTVDSIDEAVALANDSDFGLGASVWTMNRAKSERIARRIEAGMVWVERPHVLATARARARGAA